MGGNNIDMGFCDPCTVEAEPADQVIISGVHSVPGIYAEIEHSQGSKNPLSGPSRREVVPSLIEINCFLDHPFLTELFTGSFSCLCPQGLDQAPISEESVNGQRQGYWMAWWNKNPAVPHDFRYSTSRGADHRSPTGHGLHQWKPESL